MNSPCMSDLTATIRWQNTGPNFLKRRYSREHTIHFDGGVIVPGSPSPHIVPAPVTCSSWLGKASGSTLARSGATFLWSRLMLLPVPLASLCYPLFITS